MILLQPHQRKNPQGLCKLHLNIGWSPLENFIFTWILECFLKVPGWPLNKLSWDARGWGEYMTYT